MGFVKYKLYFQWNSIVHTETESEKVNFSKVNITLFSASTPALSLVERFYEALLRLHELQKFLNPYRSIKSISTVQENSTLRGTIIRIRIRIIA